MLPSKPELYHRGDPIIECYLELAHRLSLDAIDMLNVNNAQLDMLEETLLRNANRQCIRMLDRYVSAAGNDVIVPKGIPEDILLPITFNRRKIAYTWFSQIARTRFAPILIEFTKLKTSDMDQIVTESIIYQEFFEVQILATDESIDMLNNNVFRWEILHSHGFNLMLGYKYFLMLLKNLNSINYWENSGRTFDEKKIPTYSYMVENGNGAFLPCSLMINDKNFGGKNYAIQYSEIDIVDRDY